MKEGLPCLLKTILIAFAILLIFTFLIIFLSLNLFKASPSDIRDGNKKSKRFLLL